MQGISAPDIERITPGTPLVRRAIVGAVLAASPFIQACSDDPSFAVGDCVRVEQRLTDADLEPAECADAVGTFDATARVYRVDEIIGNTDGGCPQLQGFFPVEFVHEPDGVTYCLVQED
jgi:hypothetical protein